MAEVKALVEGGKASAGPPLGPALGPMGVNIGQVVAKINEKTKDFAGMKVPVTVIIDESDKSFEIEVGTPPTSALLLKEAGLEKGASTHETPVGDVSFDTIVKVARMKQDSFGSTDLKNNVKQVLGTAISVGLTVDGKSPKEVTAEVVAGTHDAKLGA